MLLAERKQGRVLATPPFDFAKSLDYMRQTPPPAMDQVVAEASFIKAFRIMGQTVVASVYSSEDGAQPSLGYTLFSIKNVSCEQEAAFRDRLKSFLSLDDDLEHFYALGKADPCFKPILEDLFGYHPVRFQSPFEAAVWAILSQRNRMATARNMFRSLVRKFGDAAELDGVAFGAFPEPEELAACVEGDLASVAHNLRRGEFLIDAARAFAMVPPDFLDSADYGEVEAWLRGINGIGPWSASFILLRGLGRAQTIPLPDRGFLDAASRVYGEGLTLDASQALRLAQRYHPWQGYWAHYLRIGA